MRFSEPIVRWVVYQKHVPGKPKMTAVCKQAEWDTLELIQPNHCCLIREGVIHEGEAEQLARRAAISAPVETVIAPAQVTPMVVDRP